MSKLNEVLQEALGRLTALNTTPVNLTGKVVVAYNEMDMLDLLKGVKSYPAVGIIYEGMRSQPEQGSTAKVGLSCELIISFVLIDQSDAVHRSDQKKTRAIDYLDAIRDQFMGQRSTATGHFWHFMVESPAELRSGMVCWVSRWSIPVQLPGK